MMVAMLPTVSALVEAVAELMKTEETAETVVQKFMFFRQLLSMLGCLVVRAAAVVVVVAMALLMVVPAEFLLLVFPRL
tara:strand:- start:186 stop:419 length:234 start_codon:yes stop_codon:yes gene_type:complete